MLYGNEQKNITAKLLKDLRKERNLSHEKLKFELDKIYCEDEDSGEIRRRNETEMIEDGVEYPSIISLSTLKNYEVHFFDGEKGSRAKAGFGMKISYIAMFADFYDVSVEYLLGLTKFSSSIIDDKAIHEKTGLSEMAIETLKTLRNNDINKTEILNSLLEVPNFNEFLYKLFLLKIAYINKHIYLSDINRERIEKTPEDFNYWKTITLSPMKYYSFTLTQLEGYFKNIIITAIESSVKNFQLNYLIELRQSIIKNWENSTKLNKLK